jgi:D-glycero-alpha-D-manno-heptose 1-phosphate guanylyltransferase
MKTLIILAGGFGTRLQTVVSNVPKPMAPVLGKPFLHHLMKFYTRATDIEFLISVGYKSEKIIEHFGTEFNGSKVKYFNEDEPLGTGGALLKILDDGAIGTEFFFYGQWRLFRRI